MEHSTFCDRILGPTHFMTTHPKCRDTGSGGGGAEDNEDKTYTQLLNKRMLGGGVLYQTDFRARSVVKDEKDQSGYSRKTGNPQPTGGSKTAPAERRLHTYSQGRMPCYTPLANR